MLLADICISLFRRRLLIMPCICLVLAGQVGLSKSVYAVDFLDASSEDEEVSQSSHALTTPEKDAIQQRVNVLLQQTDIQPVPSDNKVSPITGKKKSAIAQQLDSRLAKRAAAGKTPLQQQGDTTTQSFEESLPTTDVSVQKQIATEEKQESPVIQAESVAVTHTTNATLPDSSSEPVLALKNSSANPAAAEGKKQEAMSVAPTMTLSNENIKEILEQRNRSVILTNQSDKSITLQSGDFPLLTPGVTAGCSKLSSLPPDYTSPLALEEAVGLALRNNYDLKSYLARIRSAEWDKMGAYSQYLPSIEFNYAEGAETSSPGSYNDDSGSRIATTTHHRRDRSYYIRQPIIDLAVLSDIMRTREALNVSEVEHRDAQDTAAFSTVQAYLALLQASRSVELYDDYQRFLDSLEKRMQARFEDGGATNSDVNKILSRKNLVQAGRLQALGEYGINIAELKRLTNVVPTQFVVPEKIIPDIPPTPESALRLATKNNPTYIAALAKIDLAEQDRNKSFAGALPKLSVEYSDSYVYNAGGAAHGDPIDGVYPNQRDKRVMLVAHWSLTGGTSIASGMSSASKMKEMLFKSIDTRAKIEQGIHTAYDALNAARQRVDALQKAYEMDQKIVSEMEDQFQNGDRSLFEILDSQERLHNTRVELLRTIFLEAKTAYQIHLQTGLISKALLEQMPKGMK